MNLHLYGYIRWYEKGSDEDVLYYGGGAAWAGKVIKLGIAYARTDINAATDKDGHLIDSWLHVKFKPLINIPILLISRYGYGELNDIETNIIGFGPGYQFNKYIQALIYYEHQVSDKEDESNLYIKFGGPIRNFFSEGCINLFNGIRFIGLYANITLIGPNTVHDQPQAIY